jgi:hypothetical protein
MRRVPLVFLLCASASVARAEDAGAPAPLAPEPPASAVAQPAPADPGPTTPAALPASEPTPAEPALAEAPMTEAELAALGLNTNQAGIDTSLQFSGFADFSVAAQFTPKGSAWKATGSAPPHPTFYVGNFNLYLKKNMTETLRTMGEVRFSYLPNGSYDIFTSSARTSTTASDYADWGRQMRWGGIEIERLYLEWSVHSLLAVRVGQFLTPYGIWNVDHGSPTYIPVQRPFVIGNSWFPERQTGFELFGRWDPSAANTIGYHLTLSNGTGPISEYMDLDDNKAVGGRVYWEYHALGELRLGGSGYYGRDTAATVGLAINPDGTFGSAETIDSQFKALAWGADISWKYRGWHLQSEWITSQRAYTREGRQSSVTFAGQPTMFPADDFSWGMYALGGYRFSWLGVMPFFVLETIQGSVFGLRTNNLTYQLGLNVRPVDVIALKVLYYHVQFFEGSLQDDPLKSIQTQVAWAF